MVIPLRSGQGHMSVGESAEEFVSIHALGRGGCCVVLWSSVTSSQNPVFRPLGDRRDSLSQFSTH